MVTTLEPKPITIKEASEVFNVPEATIRGWIHRGHLAPVGRIKKCPARGGGKVLVDSAQVEELTVNPPLNGRPRKRALDKT